MELRDFLKLLLLGRRYIFASVIIFLIVGYFYVLNENGYTTATFSVYAKLNPPSGKISEKVQNDYDQIKNTFFVIKTAESFLDSARFWLVNDFEFDNAKISARKITPQHLFIQIKQKNESSLIPSKDAIIKEMRRRQTLIYNEDLQLFSIESSDYKERQNSPNFAATIFLSFSVGIFTGIFFILLKHYFNLKFS